jgi:hypothetical protein
MHREHWLLIVLAAVLAAGCGGSSTGAANAGSGGSSGAGGSGGSAGALPDGGSRMGNPCIPSDERMPGYSGSGTSEINMEFGSADCAGAVCLSNHFQGRVSCPYGQDTTDGVTFTVPDSAGPGRPATPITDPTKRCNLPGTQAPVTVSVLPQVTGRRPKDAVYCSCRCGAPDGGPGECACPTGFDCIELWPPTPGFSNQYAGSYCVKTGTIYNAALRGASCYAPPDGGALPCGNYDGS